MHRLSKRFNQAKLFGISTVEECAEWALRKKKDGILWTNQGKQKEQCVSVIHSLYKAQPNDLSSTLSLLSIYLSMYSFYTLMQAETEVRLLIWKMRNELTWTWQGSTCSSIKKYCSRQTPQIQHIIVDRRTECHQRTEDRASRKTLCLLQGEDWNIDSTVLLSCRLTFLLGLSRIVKIAYCYYFDRYCENDSWLWSFFTSHFHFYWQK